MRGFAQHLYTLINFSDLRELVNFPCATIGVGDCEANQSSWHEAFVLQECPLVGGTLYAQLCSLYRPFVQLFIVLHCLHLETNAGLLRDRRMVYALDHNPHIEVCLYYKYYSKLPVRLYLHRGACSHIGTCAKRCANMVFM